MTMLMQNTNTIRSIHEVRDAVSRRTAGVVDVRSTNHSGIDLAALIRDLQRLENASDGELVLVSERGDVAYTLASTVRRLADRMTVLKGGADEAGEHGAFIGLD